MHICLISVEIFAWGKYGGFGKATRMLGRELVKRGVQVSAIIPRREPQQVVEELDGITVYGYDISKPAQTAEIFRECNADIFHSQEPSLGTYLAQRFHPNKKHVITFRDTRNLSDWVIEFIHPSKSHLQVVTNMLYEDNFLVHNAVRRADMRFAASNLLINRAFKKYHLRELPYFLPTPTFIPETVEKATIPTVCYVSRWDRRKRPELFIELAKYSPDVKFIAVGASRDLKYDISIRSQLQKLPNVEVHGVINQFENDKLQEIFSRSWILLNTAAREGLPVSFIEACAARCAILSSVNPDGFATTFGYYVNNIDFHLGLRTLLKDNAWQKLGTEGHSFVNTTFSVDRSLDLHVQNYISLLNS